MQHPSALPPHMRKFRPPLPVPGVGAPISSLLQHNKRFALRRKSERDFSPSHWNLYFTSKQDVRVGKDVFRVYFHQDESDQRSTDELPLLLLLHGGGFNALTWAVFVKSLVEFCHVRVMAIDIRGHGSSKTSQDTDLSVATLVNDITQILLNIFGDYMPELILMGHSMGGALAAHFVDKCGVDLINHRIIGLIVIDVVEGTAKEALSQMQQVLRSRPSGFKSIQQAIEWCIRSNQTRNLEAAKISMPGQIKNNETETCAADLIDPEAQTPSTPLERSSSQENTSFGLSTLNENSDSQESSSKSDSNEPTTGNWMRDQSPMNSFIWRINLSQTEPYWMEWFDNLSQIFLNSKGGAKLLLLAGVDRLDGPMTVGQMQGKFQMQVLPRVGHVIQEDDPDSVAHVVATYLVRNRFSTSKMDFQQMFPSC